MGNPEDPWKPSESEGEYKKVEYLSLKDGETVDVRVLDEAPKQVFVTHIPVNGKRYPVSVPRDENERVRAAGHAIKKVNAVNVLDRRDGKVKLWEFTETRKNDIFLIAKKWKKKPVEFDLSVTRTGEKLKTRYSIQISPNMEPLTEKEKGLDKTDLHEYYKFNPERLNSLLKGEAPKRVEKFENSEDEDRDEAPLEKASNPLVGGDGEV